MTSRLCRVSVPRTSRTCTASPEFPHNDDLDCSDLLNHRMLVRVIGTCRSRRFEASRLRHWQQYLFDSCPNDERHNAEPTGGRQRVTQCAKEDWPKELSLLRVSTRIAIRMHGVTGNHQDENHGRQKVEVTAK